MTVDTVNTDIFDDDKVTGILCAWFVGSRLERARFDPAALEPAPARDAAGGQQESPPIAIEPFQEAVGEYEVVLEEMVAAMNDPAGNPTDAPRTAVKKPKHATGHQAC